MTHTMAFRSPKAHTTKENKPLHPSPTSVMIRDFDSDDSVPKTTNSSPKDCDDDLSKHTSSPNRKGFADWLSPMKRQSSKSYSSCASSSKHDGGGLRPINRPPSSQLFTLLDDLIIDSAWQNENVEGILQSSNDDAPVMPHRSSDPCLSPQAAQERRSSFQTEGALHGAARAAIDASRKAEAKDRPPRDSNERRRRNRMEGMVLSCPVDDDEGTMDSDLTKTDQEDSPDEADTKSSSYLVRLKSFARQKLPQERHPLREKDGGYESAEVPSPEDGLQRRLSYNRRGSKSRSSHHQHSTSGSYHHRRSSTSEDQDTTGAQSPPSPSTGSRTPRRGNIRLFGGRGRSPGTFRSGRGEHRWAVDEATNDTSIDEMLVKTPRRSNRQEEEEKRSLTERFAALRSSGESGAVEINEVPAKKALEKRVHGGSAHARLQNIWGRTSEQGRSPESCRPRRNSKLGGQIGKKRAGVDAPGCEPSRAGLESPGTAGKRAPASNKKKSPLYSMFSPHAPRRPITKSRSPGSLREKIRTFKGPPPL